MHTHETQSCRESCIFSFNHLILSLLLFIFLHYQFFVVVFFVLRYFVLFILQLNHTIAHSLSHAYVNNDLTCAFKLWHSLSVLSTYNYTSCCFLLLRNVSAISEQDTERLLTFFGSIPCAHRTVISIKRIYLY